MVELDSLAPYTDNNGNEVVGGPGQEGKIEIVFRGSNNRLEVAPGARFRILRVVFDCSNGTAVIGEAGPTGNATWAIRVGQDATVTIGRKVTTTGRTSISAVEGTSVAIGNDVMISSEVRIRGDDGHAIFDVRTGNRVNPAHNITVGDHVWLGLGCTLLGGTSVGHGSVIGTRAIVTGSIPNNCIAVGTPARVIRRDIAWERPHLSRDKPPYKPDISALRKKSTRYWNLTTVEEPPKRRLGRRTITRLRRILRWRA